MANELFLAVPSILPQNNLNSDTNLLDFNPESQQINGNSMVELIIEPFMAWITAWKKTNCQLKVYGLSGKQFLLHWV